MSCNHCWHQIGKDNFHRCCACQQTAFKIPERRNKDGQVIAVLGHLGPHPLGNPHFPDCACRPVVANSVMI